MLPMVVGGAVFSWLMMQWYFYDNEMVFLHGEGWVYDYNYTWIAFSGLIFIFSLITFLGGTDVLMSLLSRKGLRAASALLRQKLASGKAELDDWRSSRRAARRSRRTGRRTSGHDCEHVPRSDHQ